MPRLIGIDELEGPCLGEPATSVGLDKSALCRTVDGLANDGLVQREPGRKDRRETCLLLTENGKVMCERIHTENDALFVGVLEGIEADSQQVIWIFEGLVESLSGHVQSAAACSKGCRSR